MPGTLDRIQRSGVLRLITTRSLNNFYIYKDEPTGFEYELAREFARYLHVDLDVVTPGWNHLLAYLDLGKGDFVGAGMKVNQKRMDQVDFSIPYMEVQQQIVHHALTFGPKDIRDLAFRTIHVRRDTSYHYRLEEIQSSGIDVHYVLYDNMPTEDLIAMVHDRRSSSPLRIPISPGSTSGICRTFGSEFLSITRNPWPGLCAREILKCLSRLTGSFCISGKPESLSRLSTNIMVNLKISVFLNSKPFTNGFEKSFPGTGRLLKWKRKSTDLIGV